MAWVNPSVGRDVARMCGANPIMDEVARGLAAEWQAASIAAGYRTGDYASSIHVETRTRRSGVMDRVVVADGDAAIPIEFGHVTPSGTVVPGQHLARRVAG